MTGTRGQLRSFIRSLPALATAVMAISGRTAAAGPALDSTDVAAAVDAAALALAGDDLSIAVVDRAGRPLAVFSRPMAGPVERETALGLARTGAFFSNDQAPLSSRTVAYISDKHFPPGVRNTAAGALFGIEHTNRGCDLNALFLPGQDLPPAAGLGGLPGSGTGPVTKPGGVPLYKVDPVTGTFHVVGGIGVAGADQRDAAFRAREYAALVALLWMAPGFLPSLPKPRVIFLDGIELPFVEQKKLPDGFSPGSLTGAYDLGPLGPLAGGMAPEGYLVGPSAGSMLTSPEVDSILSRAVEIASRTRAAIRLPPGSRTRMAIAVADLDGTVLGLLRMPDATVFSVDVAVAKARNVVWFSSPLRPASELPGVRPGVAVTNRTIGFGAQPLFPSGINGTAPGPFRDLFEIDALAPCTQGGQPPSANQNGIVFFPGSTPLYRDGVMVGGLGVSGDGVEQDDFVTAKGAKGFKPPKKIRADRITIDEVRLPFWKFPRNPTD